MKKIEELISLPESVEIVKYRLDDDTIVNDAKMIAIENVAYMETHNSIKKDEIIRALRWIFDNYAVEREKNHYDVSRKLIEAAKMIKDFCDERCEDVECPFLREYGCGINDTENPKYWYIPEPKRWSREDVALAKVLKAAGVTEICATSSGQRAWRSDDVGHGYLPDSVFKNVFCGEVFRLDDILKEAEE